ncbi:MAG: cupin domain-containing protein [bacterium]
MDEVVEQLIDRLDLEPHPEGGYYRRTYESSTTLRHSEGETPTESRRRAVSAILYLLPADDVSRFHRLHGDEIWCYHWGSSLRLHLLDDDSYETRTLGPNLESGENPQVTVPGGTWFGATVEDNYTLVTCTVIPEFRFEDYELADREELLEIYPDQSEIIHRLT